jgi:lysine-N-methylase
VIPTRPRLAEHALPRRHLVEGVEMVVVHDARSGALIRMERRIWEIVAAADGTRDMEAILLAASRRGALRRASEVREVMAQLHEAGLLADGIAYAPPAAEVPGERPLDVLPGFALTCDGRGGCCGTYGTVLFTPLEAARARALRPEVLGGGERQARAFTPERGGGDEEGALAVALVDGRCAYLAADGRCGLHVLGGAEAKPRGCRVYPATFVDDGEVVRVSVGVECACVLASVGREGGAPLVPEGARTRADLLPGTRVATLPESVAVTASTRVPRAAFVAWSRWFAERIDDAVDPIGFTWSSAAAIEAHGLALAEPIAEAAPDLAPMVPALLDRARARAVAADAWRAGADRSRQASHAILAAAQRIAQPAGLSAALHDGRSQKDERFYLRALVHGHALAGEILVDALRERALRMALARAMAGEHTLALVEAMMRGQGLGG